MRGRSLPALAVASLAVAVFALGLACSRTKDAMPATHGAGGATGASAHVPGTPATNRVIEAITKGSGLRAEGFVVLQPVPLGAGYCEQGRIEAIDTLVCEFADDGGLERGKKLIQEQWGRDGVQTGVATATQHTLLGVADRGHHDPNGKTISQILAAFRKI
jgi:hypothetical protein